MKLPVFPGQNPRKRYLLVALLGVAILGTLWVPVYARSAPKLGPFPFFYWFQFIWVPISSALCWISYLLLRTRPAAGHGEGASR